MRRKHKTSKISMWLSMRFQQRCGLQPIMVVISSSVTMRMHLSVARETLVLALKVSAATSTVTSLLRRGRISPPARVMSNLKRAS